MAVKYDCSLSTVSTESTLHLDSTDTEVRSTVLYMDKEQSYDANKVIKVNVNQNENEDHDYEVQKRSSSLQYAEEIADSTLRNTACKLALKATALRDLQLSSLIDNMISSTHDALWRYKYALQQSQSALWRSKSNGFDLQKTIRELKQTLKTVHQQLDTRDKQERLCLKLKNDIVHLESKITSLQQKNENLDSQMTALQEEKAHNILKIETCHRKMKMLLKSLDQATKNSKDKLSVADRDISNIEQYTKTENLEIMSLKKKLTENEGRMRHLWDLVETCLSTEETRKKEVKPMYHSAISPKHQRQQCTEDTRMVPHRKDEDNLQRAEQPNDDDHCNDIRKNQSTEFSTLKSETISKSVASAEVSLEDPSDEAYVFISLND